MGRPWVFLVAAVCATQVAFSTDVEYDVITDPAVLKLLTGLTPTTPTSGFGFKLNENGKSKNFRIAVPEEFIIEVVVPSAKPYGANRYLTVAITNPTTKTDDKCKVNYQQSTEKVMSAFIVRGQTEDTNYQAVNFKNSKNAFVAEFGVKADGTAGIIPHVSSRTCTYPPFNNAPKYGDDKWMIDIKITSTNFPPNAEVNFPADVSFLAPKATTTTTTTTTIKGPTSTVPEDAPAEAEEGIENTTAAVAKASAGKVVAIVVPIVLVIILILVIAILGFVGYLKRETLMAWYTNRKNRGKSTKKDPEGATGASEDQQDGSRSVMPTATDRSTVNPSVQQKSAKQNTSERQKPSEEPSEKSKATVKQTSVEPSTKKVNPVKQTSAEPSTKKVTPVKQTSAEPSTKKVDPVKQTSAEPSAKKVNAPEQQYDVVNPQLNVQQPAKPVNAPDPQKGTVNPQLNVPQPPQPAKKADDTYELLGPLPTDLPPPPGKTDKKAKAKK